MKLYVVRNKEGKFFKTIGYGRFGKSWVDGLEQAKFYTKIGTAKSRVTYFYKNHPTYGCPDIVEFDISVGSGVVLDMSKDTDKKIRNSKKSQIKRLIRNYECQVTSIQKKIDRIEKIPVDKCDRHAQKSLIDAVYDMQGVREKINRHFEELRNIK